MAYRDVSCHQQHNEMILQQLRPGDLVKFDRSSYEHWAVYAGDGKVIHVASDKITNMVDSLIQAAVEDERPALTHIKEENFWKAAGESKADLGNVDSETWRPLRTNSILSRARGRLGPYSYCPIEQNCEHFAMWCRYNKAESLQIHRLAREDRFYSSTFLSKIKSLADYLQDLWDTY